MGMVSYTWETLPLVSQEDSDRVATIKDEDIDYFDMPGPENPFAPSSHTHAGLGRTSANKGCRYLRAGCRCCGVAQTGRNGISNSPQFHPPAGYDQRTVTGDLLRKIPHLFGQKIRQG
jgi:hypothetical protein